MLKFLLDEHISPRVGEQLCNKCPSMSVYTLQTWEDGRYLQLPDDVLMTLAYQHSLTLVTYDLRTIPLLLSEWAALEQDHAGVIFIDQKTIQSSNFGLLVKSLMHVWNVEKKAKWKNRVMFLEAHS